MKLKIREFLNRNSINTSKKLFLAASLFVAFAVSAKKTQVVNKVKTEVSTSAFKGINLTQSQKAKIAALSKQKLSSNSYNSKLKSILTKSQYAQYLKNTQQKAKTKVANYKSNANSTKEKVVKKENEVREAGVYSSRK